MRVIAGRYKGRRLKTTDSPHLRPTAARVKEALFNMIAPHLANAVVLDLYAGSGALGIEALSRGAKQAIFADNHLESLRLIRENLTRCDAMNQAIIRRGSALTGSLYRTIGKLISGVDLVLMDPPYNRSRIETTLLLLAQSGLLKESAVAVTESEGRASNRLEFEFKNKLDKLDKMPWKLMRQRIQGRASIAVWRYDSSERIV